jgi:hypothetical protein
MLRRLSQYQIVFLAAIIFFSCQNNDSVDDKMVARVGIKRLWLSEISSVVPNEASQEDSTIMAEDYIKKWIKRELMIQKAEENLSAEQKNVTRELEDYRNSLIIYRYKNELLAQKMDTSVTEEQIFNYYINNSDNFKLNNNIVKAIFIKIPDEFSNPEQLKSMCRDTDEQGIIELREYCHQYAKGFDNFNGKWVDFELVAKNIPQPIEKEEQFLRQNAMLELNDSNYYYLVAIQDYKLRNDQAPLEYVSGEIKNLILNHRKIEFLKQLENNVYSEGLRKNDFEIIDIDN